MTTSEKATVMVVDDHPVFRRGLRGLLEDAPWVGRVVEAGSAEEAVRTAVVEQVDVVAMDLVLPHGSGLEATTAICRARPRTAVLILTMSKDRALPAQLLAAGARGYLLKEVDGDLIVDALHAVGRGALVLGPDVGLPGLPGGTSPNAEPSLLDTLTPREQELLAELSSGRTNAQIGRRLRLSEKTVRNLLSAVYAKIGVTDRTQAAIVAHDAGLRPRGSEGRV